MTVVLLACDPECECLTPAPVPRTLAAVAPASFVQRRRASDKVSGGCLVDGRRAQRALKCKRQSRRRGTPTESFASGKHFPSSKSLNVCYVVRMLSSTLVSVCSCLPSRLLLIIHSCVTQMLKTCPRNGHPGCGACDRRTPFLKEREREGKHSTGTVEKEGKRGTREREREKNEEQETTGREPEW